MRPENKEKINNVIVGCKRIKADIMLMQEKNCKQNTCAIGKVKNEMKEINKNVKIFSIDSGDEINKKFKQLPGGTSNAIQGTWINQIMLNTQCKDRIGKWGTFKIGNNEKRILMINACRKTKSTKAGDRKTKVQLGRIDRLKNANENCKKMLDDIVKYVNERSQ